MNLLIDRLPTRVEIGGERVYINHGFRYGVLFELLLSDPELTEREKAAAALKLWYPEVPEDTEAAIKAALRFYRGGEEEPGPESNRRAAPVYSFEQDDGLIAASFYSAYGIDLTKENPHWWTFRALLKSLDETTPFGRAVSIRAATFDGLDAAGRKELRRLKAAFRLGGARRAESFGLGLSEIM